MDTIQQEMTGFLDSLNSSQTQRAYRTPLQHFCTFLEENGVKAGMPAEALTVDHAVQFVAWLRQFEYARTTIQLYLTAITRFYHYLLDYGAPLSANDMARLERRYAIARDIRGESRPKDPKIEAVEAVIRCARAVPARTDKGGERHEMVRLRDIAIVETLRATGCRVGELVGIRLNDIDPDTTSVLVKGKGSKWRHVYWDEVSWRSVCTYLRARKVTTAANAAIFVGHSNRSSGPLSTRHVDRLVQRLAKQAGVEDVTPHYFRHVFATRALARTGNLALVQDMLGHASPVTTRVYARTNEGQRQAAHAQVWA